VTTGIYHRQDAGLDRLGQIAPCTHDRLKILGYLTLNSFVAKSSAGGSALAAFEFISVQVCALIGQGVVFPSAHKKTLISEGFLLVFGVF
jgi:hypothetical protein